MSIRTVLFDFDGTLADTLPLSFEAFKTVFKRYDARNVTNEQLVSMFGPTEEGIIAKNFTNQHTVSAATREYYDLYKQGHEESDHSDRNIVDLLRYIKSQGIKVGVVTGKSREAFRISSDALCLSGYFDAAITGDDVVRPKPDPEGIRKALDILEADASSTVFIGDSNADIRAGKAAGLRTYGVQWLSTYQSLVFDIEPDAVFKKTSDFIDLLGDKSCS